MKVVMTILVRDEADIVESTLRYHLSNGVDHIIATDNCSVDGTTEILRKYEKMGCLDYLHESAMDYSQEKWVTRMARLASSRHGADWVINCDGDEFFHPLRGGLKDVLLKVPGHVSMLSISRNDFVAVDRDEVMPPPVEMIYKMNISPNDKGRTLPPKVIHRGSDDVIVHRGNHKVTGPRFAKKSWFRKCKIDFPDIEVFHYPTRSFRQFETKVRNSGMSVVSRESLSENEFSRVRRWYRMMQEGRLAEEYTEYHYDPVRLEQAVAAGLVVEDTRLKDYFTRHPDL